VARAVSLTFLLPKELRWPFFFSFVHGWAWKWFHR
jgi:hypothetical protein